MLNRYFCMSEPNRSGKLSHLPNRTDINCCGIPNCAILKCGCKAHHAQIRTTRENAYHGGEYAPRANAYHARECTDRKSTRLNSSHITISYAVFCLKKKKKKIPTSLTTQH